MSETQPHQPRPVTHTHTHIHTMQPVLLVWSFGAFHFDDQCAVQCHFFCICHFFFLSFYLKQFLFDIFIYLFHFSSSVNMYINQEWLQYSNGYNHKRNKRKDNRFHSTLPTTCIPVSSSCFKVDLTLFNHTSEEDYERKIGK